MKAVPSRILKKGAEPDAPPGADEPLAAARLRAQEIVAAAAAEAERLRAEVSGELAAIRAASAAEGYAEGAGSAAALLARAAQAGEARLAALEGAVVEAALEVARRIVGRELATAPAAAVDMARRALRAAAGCGDVVLRASPGDLTPLREADAELRALVERGALTISEDPSLGRGEVIVEALGGRVDARIEAQLEPFRRALGAERR